jgi:hypothetical protein
MSSKTFLTILGVVILVMGVWGLFWKSFGVVDPTWHAILKIIVGLVSVYIGSTDKK